MLAVPVAVMAAALAALKGVSPRALPYSDLRTALLKAGCYLG